MRITFVLDHAGMSGGVRVVAIYARMLQARGHRVQIISRRYRTPGRRDRALSWLRQVASKVTGQVEPSHLNGIDVEHRELAASTIPDDRIVPDGDVVVATWWETAEWVAALSPSKGAKVYFVQHYEVHEGQPIDRVKATWSLPLHKIAVSQWLVDLARDQYGDLDVTLVPNAVDHAQFSAPPRGRRPAPTVGMMYSTASYKGCDICLRAVELARKKIPGLRFVAFGMHEPRADLPLPPETEFHLLPPQERLAEIYASCDAWLFGSRTEGFGLPLLEAMACRTPVIATPAGAAPELVAEGGGVLVRPEDPADMAAAIARVATMSDVQWRELSDAAFECAAERTWERAADRFEQALTRVAAARERALRGPEALLRRSTA